MPKSRTHWGYDLLTVLLVALVSAFVFWALPAQAGDIQAADVGNARNSLAGSR
jgi:hypothetical protein